MVSNNWHSILGINGVAESWDDFAHFGMNYQFFHPPIHPAYATRHQYSQQFVTFARIFIANGIDKIHTLSSETALL